ncbi:MAG: hypothetical protein II482_02380 [Lachnospiraceae bacterium]|nr:hypothetical protein [Lachnospiraceae bacterium]
MYYNNKRLALSIFWMVLGIVLIILNMTDVLDQSIYSGMGSALTVVGFFQAMRNLRYRKDKDYREKIDTELGDERNSFLRMKSWAWTGYIVVLAEGIGVVIAMITGQELLCRVLSWSVCLIVGVYWITYMVLSRKY